MKNKEKVERVYNEIHAPEALVWKVRDMSKEIEVKRFKTRNVVKYAVCALAVMAMTFVASNGICYAATGETWVEKIKLTINDEEKEVDMNWRKDGEGRHGVTTFQEEDGSESTVAIDIYNDAEFETDVIIKTGDDVDENEMEEEKSVIIEVKDRETSDPVTIENKVEE